MTESRPTVDLAALDAEIARRRAPDYQWFPKPNDNQTPAGRAGAAAARAMQHGELTGLVIARTLVAARYPDDRLRTAAERAVHHHFAVRGHPAFCSCWPDLRDALRAAARPADGEGLREALDEIASFPCEASIWANEDPPQRDRCLDPDYIETGVAERCHPCRAFAALAADKDSSDE